MNFNIIRYNSLLKQWSKKDYFIFFIFLPAIIVLIYLLPSEIKNILILNPKNPTALSVFFSNYTHSTLPHILSNLIGYMITIFLLFNIETDKIRFYKTALVILTVLPIFSSLLIVYFIPQLPNVQGFSAIASGFIGYMLYSLPKYLEKFYYVSKNNSLTLLILMMNFTILMFYYSNYLISSSLLVVTLVLLYINRNDIKSIFQQLIIKTAEIKKNSYFEEMYKIYVFLFLLVITFSLPVIIPSEIRIGTNVINTPAHYLGYVFGVCAPKIINKLG